MRPAALAFVTLACIAAGVQAETPKAPSTLGVLLDCLDGRATMVSAHRGGFGPGWPENALETFAHTVAAGPIMIETDVRRTRDGVLVLMHDETVDRTTTGRGRARDLAYEEIARLKLRDPFGAPTAFAPPRLSDALAWAKGRALIQLDIKEGDTLPAVVEAVRAAEAHAFTLLILNNAEDAARAAALDARLTLNVAIGRPEDIAGWARRGVPADRLTAWTGTGSPNPALWRMLDRRGVPVGYGVLGRRDQAIAMAGSDAPYRDLARQGVDVIATDRPLAAFAAIDPDGRTRRALTACGAEPRR